MDPTREDKAAHLHTYHPGEEERLLERLIFSHRPLLLIIFLLATVFFAYQTAGLRPDASFEKMIPMEHPFIKSFMKHKADLGAGGTTIQVAVEHTRGIFSTLSTWICCKESTMKFSTFPAWTATECAPCGPQCALD